MGCVQIPISLITEAELSPGTGCCCWRDALDDGCPINTDHASPITQPTQWPEYTPATAALPVANCFQIRPADGRPSGLISLSDRRTCDSLDWSVLRLTFVFSLKLVVFRQIIRLIRVSVIAA